jgi:hypothetical protein
MSARIRNWHKFQHYRKRNPPWIKLHRNLLDDKEWHELDGEAAKALIMLFLLASELDGELLPIATLAFRLRMSEPDAQSLISRLSHWLEHDAGTTLAPCLQDATTETEAETEAEKTKGIEPYFFKSGVIRLSRKDFEKWKDAFQRLDLKAELLALTPWANEHGSKWYFPVSGALAKRNREQKAKLAQAKAGGRHSPNDPLAGIL